MKVTASLTGVSVGMEEKVHVTAKQCTRKAVGWRKRRKKEQYERAVQH